MSLATSKSGSESPSATHSAVPADPIVAAGTRRVGRGAGLRMPLVVLLAGGVLAAGLAVMPGGLGRVRELAAAVVRGSLGGPAGQHAADSSAGGGAGPAVVAPPRPEGPWDGSVRVTQTQQQAIGVRVVPVESQTEPLDLEVQGTTEYNPDTLVKIRPRFDAVVLAVHATVGQAVSKGDPLVELYSVRLAEAKLEYESKQSQADHDRQIADHQRDLVSKGVIPESSRVLLDAVNAERRSLLEFKLARDELEVFGVPPEEIARVHLETGTEKARMTLRAPSDGTIVARDVAVGNIYDSKDTLLVIASIEELWVWGHVYERDLADVRSGLSWEVHFPFSHDSVEGTVAYVSNQVDPQTHAVRIRGSIPNPAGRFKSDQLVRVLLKCPPRPGRIRIPRRAVVTSAGSCFVFVQRAGEPDVFERRRIEIDREFSDRVIVASGLRPGDEVVTTGSLVMGQIWEDRHAIETGEAS